MVVLEDAHWLDPTTEALFGELIDRIARYPIFLLVTFRGEYTPPWIGPPNVALITLTRLSSAHGRGIIRRSHPHPDLRNIHRG